MKRADITKLFPEASKEAIDELMSINGADVNAARAAAEEAGRQAAESGASDLAAANQQIEQLTSELNGFRSAEAARTVREKVAREKGIPVHLLTGDTEEACAAQADSILEFAQPAYPAFRDGGEPSHTPSTATRDKFAEWAQENL